MLQHINSRATVVRTGPRFAPKVTLRTPRTILRPRRRDWAGHRLLGARLGLRFGRRGDKLLCHTRLASVAAAAVRADGRPPARLAHVVLSTVRTQPGPAAVLTYHPSATVRADGTAAALLAQRSLPRVCPAEPAAAALPARRALATVGTYRRPAAVFAPAALTTVRTRAAHPARRAILRAVGTRLSR